MTVQEVIDFLQSIENKNSDLCILVKQKQVDMIRTIEGWEYTQKSNGHSQVLLIVDNK